MTEKEDIVYVSSDINEIYGTTEVTQYFTNTLDSPIELSVGFPILEEINLTKFLVTIGEKTIASKVMSKEKAEEKYNDSLASGNTGIMSTYDNSLKNYTVNIGNILPKQKLKLSTFFIQMLGANDMSYEFKIIESYPTFNYNNKEQTNFKKVEVNLNIKAQSKITRLISPFMSEEEKKNTQYRVDFENDYKNAIIKYTQDFNTSHSNSKSLIEKNNGNQMNQHIFLSTFCILFRTEKINLPTLYYQYNEKLNETSYSINYTYSSKSMKPIPIPSEPDQDSNISYDYKYHENKVNETPGVFVFLVDQSGSMSGESIELVKKSLVLFMQSLPVGSYFQLIGFGSDFEKYNEEPVEYNKENVNKIINIINGLNADKGGTNISGPLKEIYNSKDDLKLNLCKSIFVLTDGEVFDKEKCINVIKENCDKYRLHAIGIGSSFDKELIEDCGKYGKGSFSFVSNINDVNMAVIEALNICLKPYLSDIKFNFINYEKNMKNNIVSCSPEKNLVYQDEIINYSFILDNENKIDIDNLSGDIKVEMEAKDPINKIKDNISFSKNVNIIKLQNGDEMGKMIVGKGIKYNKEFEDEKKEIEFAKKYQILSKNTALFAEIQTNEKIEKLIKVDIKEYNYHNIGINSNNDSVMYHGTNTMNLMGMPIMRGMDMNKNMMYNNGMNNTMNYNMGMNMGMNNMGMNMCMNNMCMNNMGMNNMMNYNMMGMGNTGMTNPMMSRMNIMNMMNNMSNNMNNYMNMNQNCSMANSYTNSHKIKSDSQNTNKNTDKLESLNKETSKIKNNNLTLENLIMNQDIIEGSWTENDVTKQLIDIISKNKFDYISKEIKKLNKGEIETELIYTIMVIYYLKTHYSSKINEYKLVINKAIKFLLKHGINYDDIQL